MHCVKILITYDCPIPRMNKVWHNDINVAFVSESQSFKYKVTMSTELILVMILSYIVEINTVPKMHWSQFFL